MCIIGTDRTLSNGDVIKLELTFMLYLQNNNVPFYVALPSSTID